MLDPWLTNSGSITSSSGRFLGLCGGFRFDESDVRDVERALAFHDPAFRALLGFLLMLFDHPHVLDDDLRLGREDLEDGPLRALVVSRDDDHFVALVDVGVDAAHVRELPGRGKRSS